MRCGGLGLGRLRAVYCATVIILSWVLHRSDPSGYQIAHVFDASLQYICSPPRHSPPYHPCTSFFPILPGTPFKSARQLFIMPSLFKTPTSTITMVPFNARVPIDVFIVVLSYVNGVDTLRSCALVCSSWHLHIRPYLFRQIVYRPAIPSRTFKDLEVFLS